jgi:lysine biosynthesis protein LysW
LNTGRCPECDGEVTLPEPVAYEQRVSCGYCGAQLLVISLNPLELDWAFIEPLPNQRFSVDRGVDMRDRV